MPIIAVAGAVGAAAFAAVDIATVGIAAFGALQALEVVTAVGATVGAIGAVTGNKDLSLAGMALGLVGGIGALATSAGAFGAEAAGGSSLFGPGPAASAAEGTGSFAEGVAPATSGTIGGPIDAGTWDVAGGAMSANDAASAGTIDFVTGSGLGQPPPSDLTTLASTSENATDPALLSGTRISKLTDAPTSLMNSTASTGLESAALNPTGPEGTAQGQTELNQVMAEGGLTGGTPAIDGDASGAGVFGKILKFAGDNKLLTYGAVQAAGSFLSGATSSLTPAQVSALNAQAAANQAAANLATQQTANLAMPRAVATTAPVTGTPAPIIPPRPAGLINSTPRLAPITGVPA